MNLKPILKQLTAKGVTYQSEKFWFCHHHKPARADSGGGEGESQGNAMGGGGRRMPSFLGRKLPGVFGQPAFFLTGNCLTILAFEIGVPLKA